jgi:hypothetical protein
MVADAWLALPDDQRARLAPCFAAFDPTDLAGISHIKRMYDKYPGMWRAIGEVMCRHDDLTTMLLGKVCSARSRTCRTGPRWRALGVVRTGGRRRAALLP